MSTGFTSFYLRVLTEGMVAAGEGFELLRAHPDQITIAGVNDVIYERSYDIALIGRLAELTEFSRTDVLAGRARARCASSALSPRRWRHPTKGRDPSRHPAIVYHTPTCAIPVPAEVVTEHSVWGVKDSGGKGVLLLFDFYERGAPYIETDFQERRLPAVQEWETYMRATIAGLVHEALVSVNPDERTVQAVSALLDFSIFKSFLDRANHKEQAAMTVNEVLLSWLEGSRRAR